MPRLQPALVFSDEVNRINALYWTSSYSFKRTVGILNLLSNTGLSNPDPRVSEIWNDIDIGEAARTSYKLSDFISILDANSTELRSVSILKICSAFENALSGYFALCSLYDPSSENPSYTGKKIPEILTKQSDLKQRKKAISERCTDVLYGKYSKRVNLICKTWGLTKPAGTHINRLNKYYETRHLIAHDQSLTGADSPEMSSEEIMSTRVVVTEESWKRMLADFTLTIQALDSEVSSKIVSDGGLALAIYRIIQRDGDQDLASVHKVLADEWRIGNPKRSKTIEAAKQVGYKVKQVDGNRYRITRA